MQLLELASAVTIVFDKSQQYRKLHFMQFEFLSQWSSCLSYRRIAGPGASGPLSAEPMVRQSEHACQVEFHFPTANAVDQLLHYHSQFVRVQTF